MKIAVIGIGKLGGALAYTLLVNHSNNTIVLFEPHGENKVRANGEFWDLLPVANATGNKLLLAPTTPKADVYIVTSGKSRTNVKQKKEELLGLNLGIVCDCLRGASEKAMVYIATNPPKEICKGLERFGIKAKPLRACTDSLRGRDAPRTNRRAFVGKGFTQWTPAFAMVKEIMEGE